MKKIKLLSIMMAVSMGLFAQSPQAIPYQAVARDAAGNLLTKQSITLKFTVRDGVASGTVVFSETHTTVTNELGLFTANIGQGTPVTGTFTSINWGSNAKFMQIEMDPAGGSAFIDMGTSQMLSVPYALFAEKTNLTDYNFYFADRDGDGRGDKFNVYYGPNALSSYVLDSTDNDDDSFKLGTPPSFQNNEELLCNNCNDLISFEPRTTLYYDDYPIFDETTTNQYRSFLQQEVVQAIKYATAKTYFSTLSLNGGHTNPLGLGEMSESDGSIPGTSINEPGHPEGTHVNGLEIDLAYYQLNGTDNHLRPVCEHIVGRVEQYHCIAPPNNVDLYKTAFLIACLAEHPKLRVVGVDGAIGPLLQQKLNEYLQAGWISSELYDTALNKLIYETENNGAGWYLFHFQNMHVSFSD